MTDNEKEQAARKEGNLIVYASLRGVLQDAIKAFRRKYEDLNVHASYYSSHPVPIYEKMKAEVKAGLQTCDVCIMPQYMQMQLAKEDMLREYASPPLKFLPENLYDAKATWAAMAVEPTGMVYNPTKVKGEDLPTTLDEFTDPKWQGKTAIQSVVSFPEGKMGFYYLIALKRILGESRWTEFITNLAKNIKPYTYECLLYMTHNMGLGQHTFGFPATLRKQGMGDDYAHMREGGVKPLVLRDLPPAAIARCAGITKHGKNRSAGELFFDFILSPEWQEEMGRNLDGMVPARPGTVTEYWVSQPLDKGFLHYPTPAEHEQEKEYIDVFRSLGLGDDLPKGIG